jgi:hypothetical protein
MTAERHILVTSTDPSDKTKALCRRQTWAYTPTRWNDNRNDTRTPTFRDSEYAYVYDIPEIYM